MIIEQTNAKRPRIGFWLDFLIISILFENVKVVSAMGAAFKLLHIILIAIIIKSLANNHVKLRSFILMIVFLLIPILPIYRIADKTEWFKSYVIYVIMVLYLGTAMEYTIEELKSRFNHYAKLFVRVIGIAQFLGILQFILMNLFGVFFLRNIFGSFQFHNNQFGMQMGLYRAYSLFLEPSFFAWVSLASLALLLYCGKDLFSRVELVFLYILNVIALFTTISSSGIITFVIMLAVYASVGSKNVLRNLGFVFTFSIAGAIIWNFTDVLSPIKRLFVEVNIENTSGFERLSSPLMYLERIMHYYPLLGRGLGQEGNIDQIGIIGLYAGINNGIIGMMCTFGISVLFFFVPAILFSVRRVIINKKWLIMLVSLLGIYISTGAFCSVDTFVFLVLIISFGEAHDSLHKNNDIISA